MTFKRQTAPNFKPPKIKNGTAAGLRYMGRVKRLPCVCCGATPTSAHHCISGRYSQAKASDYDTIPLCYEHHQGATGIHANKAAWEETYGRDTDYLDVTRDNVMADWVTLAPWHIAKRKETK
jgi:hypothetical protein